MNDCQPAGSILEALNRLRLTDNAKSQPPVSHEDDYAISMGSTG